MTLFPPLTFSKAAATSIEESSLEPDSSTTVGPLEERVDDEIEMYFAAAVPMS